MLTPASGTRAFLADSAFALPALASVLYLIAAIYMAGVERQDTLSLAYVLVVAGALCLTAGLLTAWLGSLIKGVSDFVPAVGLALLVGAAALFFIVELADIFRTATWLEFIQSFVLLGAFVLLAVESIWLILSFLRLKVKPQIGGVAAAVGALAAALLLVRLLTTYASLSSALGSDYNWGNTEELASQVRWMLRSVDTGSKLAAKMYNARLLERIASVLALASLLPRLFSFGSYFDAFNKQLDYALEIPANRRNYEREMRNGSWEDDRRDDDDFYDLDNFGIGSRQADERYIGSRAAQSARARAEAANAQRLANNRAARQSAPPSQPTQQPAERETVLRNSKTGAAVVKVKKREPEKPAIPDPNDPSFWNQYKD